MALPLPPQGGRSRTRPHLVGSGAGIAAHPATPGGNPYCPLAAPSWLRKTATVVSEAVQWHWEESEVRELGRSLLKADMRLHTPPTPLDIPFFMSHLSPVPALSLPHTLTLTANERIISLDNTR